MQSIIDIIYQQLHNSIALNANSQIKLQLIYWHGNVITITPRVILNTKQITIKWGMLKRSGKTHIHSIRKVVESNKM